MARTKGQMGAGQLWRRPFKKSSPPLPVNPLTARIPNTSSNSVRPVGGKNTRDWKPQHKKAYFNGGSSLDWIKFKPRMENMFTENECWHYVQPNDPVEPIVENTFDDVEPTYAVMVNNEIATQVVRVNAAFDVMIARVNAEMAIPAGGIMGNISIEHGRQELLRIENQRSVKLLEIENSESSFRDKYQTAVKDWRNHKEQHRKTVGKCIAVFGTYLGDSAKAIIKQLLKENRFREAWHSLERHYRLGLGGNQNVQEVINRINSNAYDPSDSMMQHIQYLTDLIAEMDSVTGTVTNPGLVLEWILSSIEKSATTVYAKDIDDIRRNNKTLEEAQQLFQKTESHLTMSHSHSSSSSSPQAVASLQQEIAEESVSFVQRKPMLCQLCKRPGHVQKQCWLGMTCETCGQKGHPSWRCRTQMEGDSSNGASGSNKNDKKVQFAKMFGENADKFKQSRKYFVSLLENIRKADDHVMISCNETNSEDIVDYTKYVCKHSSDVIERFSPDTSLEKPFAGFEILLESDLLTYHTR